MEFYSGQPDILAASVRDYCTGVLRWWRRGERAPGTRQIGYQWAYIFSAVRPDTGDDVTLVMPSVNAKVMDLFLAHFADTLDQDAHAVMMCDGAGWHDERALTVPDNVTLALLPPYSPELNPVERVWLYLRERFLSLRVLDDTEAIIDACCQAWIGICQTSCPLISCGVSDFRGAVFVFGVEPDWSSRLPVSGFA